MLFGLLINNLSISLGYETPLATIPLLIAFNIAFILLATIGCMMNGEPIFSFPNLNLTTPEKAFLFVPILFPALSILGTHLMKNADNNIILMFLLFLIPIYVAFVCFFNQKFPKRMYPVVIFLISISLLLLLSLRSNHIIGIDAHLEYYFFQTTLNNLQWSVFGHSPLDACLAISLLPTIYQSILNMSPEFFFKIFYSSIFSISPLIVYVISKKYVGEFYGFLASCFFMFQIGFLETEFNPRTNTAILFFALAMMTLFNDKIDSLKKRILFIVFMVSCMVSHYSTTHIFFVIMLGTFVGIELLSKIYTVKKVISLTLTLLFFAMIFFWYSQVTETAFNAGMGFIEDTLSNLNKFFIEESRGQAQALLGKDIMQKGIPHKIEFVFSWLTLALIAIGVITLIRRHKEMSFPELNFKKLDFLKDKFEVEYFVIVLTCSGLLVVMVALPYVAVGYSMDRLYCMVTTVLSVFFVIGGIITAKYMNQFIAVLQGRTLTKHFLFKERTCAKTFLQAKTFTKNIHSFDKSFFLSKKRFGENAPQIRTYLIILLVLIPYFLSVTGVTYQMFGYPRAIILNSEGEQQTLLVYDQDSYGVKWLGDHTEKCQRIYTDFIGGDVLTSQSQGRISLGQTDRSSLIERRKINGYIYLRYYNTIEDKLDIRKGGSEIYNTSDYADIFIEKNKIYDNGGSEVYR